MFSHHMSERKDKILEIFDDFSTTDLFKDVKTPADLVFVPMNVVQKRFSCDDSFDLELMETQNLVDRRNTLNLLVRHSVKI